MRWMAWMIVVSAGVMGCGAGGMAPAGAPDTPLPPGEPTEVVTLSLDLPRAQDCEEAFDLSMYASRAVHLIEWDSHRGQCTERTVRIVYRPRLATKDAVVAEARKRASRVDVKGN